MTPSAALPAATATESADVVVLGSGLSAVAAAISARRTGAGRVVLLDAGDYLGGQVAAGVGTMDEGARDRYDQRRDGMYATFVSNFLAEYRRLGWPHTSTCYGAMTAGRTVCIAPSVARRVLARMLAQAGVVVRLGATTRVLVGAGRVTGVRWQRTIAPYGGGVLRTPVVIDATEYGDAVAQSGARYRSGNGIGGAAGSSPRGHIADITYTAVVRTYPSGTMPEQLNLVGKPFPAPVGDPAPATTKAKVLHAFRLKVAVDGSRYNNSTKSAWSPLWHLQYRGLPDLRGEPYLAYRVDRIRRTVLNYANDYPNEVVGDLGGKGLPVRYLEDPAYRHKVECAAKLRTIQFVWYMQNVLGQKSWSVATDEGFDTPWARTQRCSGSYVATKYAAFEAAMPTRPYVRESRRGVGLTALRAAQLWRLPTGEPVSGAYGETSPLAAPTQPHDTIAVGYYPPDVHGPVGAADLEADLDAVADRQFAVDGARPFGPYGIPLRSLVSADVRGLLLAEKNISQSRFVAGATRMQSETSLIGAAAGTLAALAATTGRDPAAVRAGEVQVRLVRRGQLLATNRFLDLSRSHPALGALEVAAMLGIDPDERHTAARAGSSVSRADAATWIRRAVGVPAAAQAAALGDVDAAAAYAEDVHALAAAGVPVACTEGSFCPGTAITRGEFLVWLGSALDACRGTAFGAAAEPRTSRFADVVPGGASPLLHAVARHLAGRHGVVFASTLDASRPLLRKDAATWTAWEALEARSAQL